MYLFITIFLGFQWKEKDLNYDICQRTYNLGLWMKLYPTASP